MPADSPDTKKLLIDTLEFAHQVTKGMLKGFPDDKLTHQNCPTDNHVMWVVGHLASGHDWFASLIDGKPMEFPEAWQASVGYKSKPVSDHKAYPNFGDLSAAMEKAYARLLAAVKAQSSEDLAKPTHGESHGIAPTRADAAVRAAWHEGWHGGQIASARKSLGLASVM
jgi:hypothetical protein